MSDLRDRGTQAAIRDRKKSSLKKYEELVVGRKGVGSFLLYEFIMSFLSGCPGALGIWLRGKLYPLLLRECGRNVIVGRNVVFRNPGRISLGNGVTIADGCTLDAKGKTGEGIRIGDNVFIGQGTIITMADGTILIDEGSNIGSYCRIGTLGKTHVGKNVLLAAYCYLIGGGHRMDRVDIPIIEQPNQARGDLLVGDGSWLGARVSVMDGVKIGQNTIVGAHALVTRDLPDFAVAVGVPARVIKSRK